MDNKILQIINSSFQENINSHAFLMETNNIELCLNDIKKLICLINDVNDMEKLVNNCDTISDIKIVKPEGKEIKREQVSDVINNFITFPLELKHKYYIILNGEKMNQSASNTLLKFLEEPNNDVIGFFITTNKNAMVPTIISRCQCYKILYENSLAFNHSDSFFLKMDSSDIFEKILFLEKYFGKDRVGTLNLLNEIKQNLYLNIATEVNNKIVNRINLIEDSILRINQNGNQDLVIINIAREW